MNHSWRTDPFDNYLQIGNSAVKSRGLSRFSSFPLTCFIADCSYSFVRFLFFHWQSTIPISFNRSLPFFSLFFFLQRYVFRFTHTHTHPLLFRAPNSSVPFKSFLSWFPFPLNCTIPTTRISRIRKFAHVWPTRCIPWRVSAPFSTD